MSKMAGQYTKLSNEFDGVLVQVNTQMQQKQQSYEGTNSIAAYL